jgi:hypothetical protein
MGAPTTITRSSSAARTWRSTQRQLGRSRPAIVKVNEAEAGLGAGAANAEVPGAGRLDRTRAEQLADTAAVSPSAR